MTAHTSPPGRRRPASAGPAPARTVSRPGRPAPSPPGDAPPILHDHPLDELNAFGFRQRAERYAEAPDERALETLLGLAEANGWPVFVLGGGTNVVLSRDVPGLTLRLTDDRVIIERDAPELGPGEVRVRAGAGAGWHALVEATLAAGADGLENLALIPGTVGAAPVQNIGAYGVELADRLERVRAWHRPSARFVELPVDACGFGYRDSRFKRERGDWIIVRADFALGPHRPRATGYASLAEALRRAGAAGDAPPSAREVADAVIAVRRSKLPDPAVIGNAGSFFHNPVVPASEAERIRRSHPGLVSWPDARGAEKLAAGWLIDRLGYRGVRRGAVGVHRDQALVLVNEGGGTGAELLALVEEILGAVRAAYGVELTVEPVVV